MTTPVREPHPNPDAILDLPGAIEAWEDDGRWRSTVDKLRSIVNVRLHTCKGYSREKYAFKGKEKTK